MTVAEEELEDLRSRRQPGPKDQLEAGAELEELFRSPDEDQVPAEEAKADCAVVAVLGDRLASSSGSPPIPGFVVPDAAVARDFVSLCRLK